MGNPRAAAVYGRQLETKWNYKAAVAWGREGGQVGAFASLPLSLNFQIQVLFT